VVCAAVLTTYRQKNCHFNYLFIAFAIKIQSSSTDHLTCRLIGNTNSQMAKETTRPHHEKRSGRQSIMEEDGSNIQQLTIGTNPQWDLTMRTYPHGKRGFLPSIAKISSKIFYVHKLQISPVECFKRLSQVQNFL